MFVELMPLLASRTLLITIAKVDDKILRVNVIPHGKPDDNPALTTPLTFAATPEELDDWCYGAIHRRVKIRGCANAPLVESSLPMDGM